MAERPKPIVLIMNPLFLFALLPLLSILLLLSLFIIISITVTTPVSANHGLFSLKYKFAGQKRSLAALKAHDSRRVVACKSACSAFNSSRYCCTGSFGSPQSCKPTAYSKIFKAACPKAYSYAYDDPTSIATCIDKCLING